MSRRISQSRVAQVSTRLDVQADFTFGVLPSAQWDSLLQQARVQDRAARVQRANKRRHETSARIRSLSIQARRNLASV